VLLVGSAAAQAAPSYLAVVAGRLAFGVAYGIVCTTGVAWLAEREPEAGSARLGALVTSGAIGLVLGPGLGGVLGDAAGLSAPFLAVAAFALLTLALLAREPGRRRVHEPRGTSIRKLIPIASRQPAVIGGAAALGVASAVGGVLQLLVPLQLHRSGASASVIGLAFSAAAACYILVSSVSCRRRDP
jgi:predicted MFS family arabinose efflux permease